MSIELSLEPVGESSYGQDDYENETRKWNGRDLLWSDIPEMESAVVRRIMEMLAVGDSKSDLLAFKLAWIGSRPEQRPLVKKSFAHLIRTSDGWEIEEVSFGKAVSKGWKKTKKVASNAWHETCEIAEKTCEAVKEVWEEYKTEIIIGTAILAATTVVVAVTIATGGTGTEAAAAGSIALIQSFADKGDKKAQPPTSTVLKPQVPPQSVALNGESSPILSQSEILTNIHSAIPTRDPIAPLTAGESLLQPTVVPEAPPFQFSGRVNPESVYGQEYFARAYSEFGLRDPHSAPQNAEPSDSVTKSANQQLVEMLVTQINEARQPNYIDDLLTRRRPNYGEEFVQHIEKCLETVHAPDYKEQLAERELPSLYNKSFAEYMSQVLQEQIYEPDYKIARATIERLFKPEEGRTLRNNYASTLATQKPAAPFREIPLLGYADQRTVHFHCGINNTFGSVVEGGLRLNESLDKQFAVQPHQIHSSSLVKGLAVVGLGKLASSFEPILTSGIDSEFLQGLELPGALLHDTKIQTSIDYEVAPLSQIAENIIKTGNPRLKQLHVTFSNGGYVFKEALKQLSPECRDTIVVITTGTTAIIENHLACKVVNIIGDKDWPSKICNGGMLGFSLPRKEALGFYRFLRMTLSLFWVDTILFKVIIRTRFQR